MDVLEAPAITAQTIIDALIADAPECIWATELAFSSGARRIDFWKMEHHSSKGYRATAYEVKISRSDFKRDSHAKQREARLFSDCFYYVTPVGLVKPEEIPDWAGLIEFDGTRLSRKVAAPLRDKSCPSWELVVSLIRNSGEIRRDVTLERKELLGLRRQKDEIKKKLEAKGLHPWEFGIW